MRRFLRLAVLAGSLVLCSSAGADVGSSTVGDAVRTNPAGRAQDYRVTAGETGQITRLNVYLDAASSASKVELGLYGGADRKRAGSRLGRCIIATPAKNAWNRCAIDPVQVTSGRSYWLAILQPSGSSGQIQYRNRTGSGRTFGSSQSSLAALPATWSNGASLGAETASVYADLAANTPAPAPAPAPA